MSTVSVTPRDKFGNYLGPFSGSKIKVFTSEGMFEKTYADSLNGEYTFTLLHPADIKPELAVFVDDSVVAYLQPADARSFRWLILLVLALLIVFGIAYLILERRTS